MSHVHFRNASSRMVWPLTKPRACMNKAQSPFARLARLVICAALLGGGATLLLPAGFASAHASYKSSDPAPNAILTVAPKVVTIHFMENVNPQGSDIIVYDARGKQVSPAPAQVDRADLTTMTVNMSGDNSEVYLVEWHTVSADDGDPDIGGFNFLVNPSKSTIAAVTGSSNSGGAHTSSSTPASSGGVATWLAALLGALGLVIGAGALYLAQRYRLAPLPALGRPSPGAPSSSPSARH